MFRSSADQQLIESSYVVNVAMRQHTCNCFMCCLVWRGMQTLQSLHTIYEDSNFN
jgi:hypothetical protein